MKLILSDKPLNIQAEDTAHGIKYVDLSSLKISNCVGCFGCWTKTPGKCLIRDDAVKVYPYIAKSDTVLYISRLKYGSYDTIMKTMLERAIPVQMAFIRLVNGETHHVQRSVVAKNAIIIAYGAVSDKEKEIFRSLIKRNACNMSFKNYKIIFIQEDKLEEAVQREVEQWKTS